jgi:hypothetical protein
VDSDEPDREMQGTDLTNKSEGSEGSGAGRRERRPAERLARYYAACYVETPEYESQLALEMLTSWFDERTAEWVADECIRAGNTHDRLRGRDIGSPEGINTPSGTRTA